MMILWFCVYGFDSLLNFVWVVVVLGGFGVEWWFVGGVENFGSVMGCDWFCDCCCGLCGCCGLWFFQECVVDDVMGVVLLWVEFVLVYVVEFWIYFFVDMGFGVVEVFFCFVYYLGEFFGGMGKMVGIDDEYCDEIDQQQFFEGEFECYLFRLLLCLWFLYLLIEYFGEDYRQVGRDRL